MDNITHSLVGSLIGVAWAKGDRTKRPLIAASILSNNLPDADFLYASLLSHPFGYLLHHRGHTHTVIGAVFCGVLSWIIVSVICWATRRPLDKKAQRSVLLISIFGGLIHITLDWFNSYGVHPFWPIVNRWYYGDTIFIIEPFLWITLSLALASLMNAKFYRFIASIPALLGILLIVFSGRVPPTIIIGSVIITSLFVLGFKSASQKIQSRIWLLLSFGVFIVFYISGQRAQEMLEKKQETGETRFASFVAPSPANPFCWTAFQMIRKQDTIVYHRELLEPFHHFFSINCAQYSLHQIETETLPYSTFKELTNNCRWRAFLRFARVPSVTSCSQETCTADLRFSRNGRQNFTVYPLEGTCPTEIPPWEPPILDP